MENQNEKPREPRRRYTLFMMWNEGNSKEADNCDVNAKNYIDKEWSKEMVGLDSALLLKFATIWGSSNRTKYYEKWKKNVAVRRSSNDNGFLARFS